MIEHLILGFVGANAVGDAMRCTQCGAIQPAMDRYDAHMLGARHVREAH